MLRWVPGFSSTLYYTWPRRAKCIVSLVSLRNKNEGSTLSLSYWWGQSACVEGRLYNSTPCENFSGEAFPHCSTVKNLTCNAGDAGDMGSTPGLGRFPGGGNGNPPSSLWTEETAGLQSVDSKRIKHDWATKHIKEGHSTLSLGRPLLSPIQFETLSTWEVKFKGAYLTVWYIDLHFSTCCTKMILNQNAKRRCSLLTFKNPRSIG